MIDAKEDIGKKFHMLTVVNVSDSYTLPCGQKTKRVVVNCDCGATKIVNWSPLRRGKIFSCGCIVGEQHGLSGTKLYRVWRAIRERCSGKATNDNANKRYFERGITICNEWNKSFSSFHKWAIDNGYKDDLEIDRKDNNKGYYPDNCRFVDIFTNVNNREVTVMVTYQNQQWSLRMLLRHMNRSNNFDTIRYRIKAGWSIYEALETPITQGNYGRNAKKYRQKTDTVN